MSESPAPYDHKALWIKAKLFLNRALDDDGVRSVDEQLLWASLALELLGKSALARVSPLLIAEPKEDGANLLMASGLLEGDAQFISVGAGTIFKRCAKAFKPFSAAEAQTIANARNEYLHGTGVGLLAIPEKAWWPQFWRQATILINACDSMVEDLVGSDRAATVYAHLAQNKKNIEHRVEMMIERARQRLQQYDSGELPARLMPEWSKEVDLTAGLTNRTDWECPACGRMGVLEGQEIARSKPHYERVAEDDYDAWLEIEVGSDYFSCSNCRLVLESYDLIVEASLPETFEGTEEMSAFMEPEYGND